MTLKTNILILKHIFETRYAPYSILKVNKLSCIIIIFISGNSCGENLSCYQCTKTTNEHCGIESLQICPENKDRCVTHISKDGMFLKN